MMTRRHFQYFIFYPFAILTALITALWLATPFVAEHYLTAFVKEQGQELTIGKLSVDFFPPKVDLKNIGITDQEQDKLNLKRAVIEVKIWPLFTKTLHISEAYIEGLKLTVAQKQKDWIVAGINTTQFLSPANTKKSDPNANSEKASTPETNSTAWAIKLPSFSFTDSQVILTRQPNADTPTQSDTFTLSKATIDDLYGQGLNWKGKVSLSAMINKASLSVDSKFDYSPKHTNANLNIKNADLSIESLRHFIPAPYNEGKGQLVLSGGLVFTQQEINGVANYNINNLVLTTQVDNLNLALNKEDKVTTQSTSFNLSKGRIHFASVNELAVNGTLALSSKQSLFAQGNKVIQFDQLDVNSPFDLKRDAKSLTATGKLNIKLDKSSFSQAELNTQLNKLTLNTPFDISQNELGLKATGDLDIQLEKSLFAQANQKAQFDNLTLNTPFDIKQDKKLGLNAKVASTKLDINGFSLALDTLGVQNQQLTVTLDDVSVTMDPQKALSASLHTAIESNNLAIQQAGNKVNYKKFNLTNTLSLKKQDSSFSANNSQLDIDIQGLKALLSDEKQVSLATVKLNADQINVDQTDQQPPRIKGTNLNFTSESLDSLLTDKKRIASWQNANFNGLSFTQQDQNYQASLDQLNIADLVVSEPKSSSDNTQHLPPLSHIGSIKIEKLDLNQDGAKINKITTDSVKVNLILDGEKRIENLVFVESKPPKLSEPSLQGSATPRQKDAQDAIKSTKNAEQNPAFKPPYYVVLNAFDIIGKSSIYVQDKSITPNLRRSLNIDTFSLRNLNTQEKNQATVLKLKARSGKYATLKSDVTIWPLADKLTMKSDLIIREAELPPYSSYIANVLGYQIDSGQLDLDLTLNADDGVLNGNSHIVLREFDLGGRKESSSVIKAGAVPLNIAVGILKDSNNNIDLDIPLSGDTEKPEFGWQDFLLLPVRKALYSASSTYLMQTFIPYANVISIAQFAGDQLLKIRVEPLIFNAEESELNDSQNAFLKQLVALMKNKKDSQLKACGVASYLDLGFEKSPVSIDNDMKESARNLAEKRAEHLKDYLVAEGISSSRVFLCSPEVDLSKRSKPRVELNF
ncbi:MAG: DUF748 domain-containing protein [Oceanospirillaceae bacterium]|nr:DUF748 domain-containing protein [Oceanospirillaceae bacterium]